jgi:hypothetical protein
MLVQPPRLFDISVRDPATVTVERKIAVMRFRAFVMSAANGAMTRLIHVSALGKVLISSSSAPLDKSSITNDHVGTTVDERAARFREQRVRAPHCLRSGRHHADVLLYALQDE